MDADATNDDRLYRHAPKGGVIFQSGTGTGAVFWGVLVVIFGAVAGQTSGIASDVLWAIAGLAALLGAINLVYYLTGRGRGHWTGKDERRRKSAQLTNRLTSGGLG
jgi:hypothetical protein